MKTSIKVVSLIAVFALTGCATNNVPKAPIGDQIDAIFANYNGNGNYDRFKAVLIQEYERPLPGSTHHKTVAVAIDLNGEFAVGTGFGGVSPSPANAYAMRRCLERREERSIKAECEFFSKNERVVLDLYE